MLIRASLPFRGSNSCFRYGCLAEYALGTHKHLYACVSLMRRTHTSARQLSQRRRGRGVSNNRFVCSLRPFQKTWLRLHCRSFVEEDKRAAPAEIPQPCNRNHVYDFHNIERKRKCSGHFWLYNLKKMEGGGDVISHVNMSKPLGLFSVFKPFFANSKK